MRNIPGEAEMSYERICSPPEPPLCVLLFVKGQSSIPCGIVVKNLDGKRGKFWRRCSMRRRYLETILPDSSLWKRLRWRFATCTNSHSRENYGRSNIFYSSRILEIVKLTKTIGKRFKFSLLPTWLSFEEDTFKTYFENYCDQLPLKSFLSKEQQANVRAIEASEK